MEWKLVPSKYGRGKCSHIVQRGNVEDSANYRPISLLQSIYKICAGMIKNRLANGIDERIRNLQFGVRRKKSTAMRCAWKKQRCLTHPRPGDAFPCSVLCRLNTGSIGAQNAARGTQAPRQTFEVCISLKNPRSRLRLVRILRKFKLKRLELQR